MNVLGYGMFGKWIWTSVVCRFCGLYELCVGQCIWMHGLVNAGLGFGMCFYQIYQIWMHVSVGMVLELDKCKLVKFLHYLFCM
jgi:hypothetical protein